MKTREAHTKESTILKRQKENKKKRTHYQERAGHYSACSSPSPISSTSASSSLPQFSSTGGAVLPTWMLPKKSRTTGLHLSSSNRSPTRDFCFPSSSPPPHHGLLVLPLVAVLEQVASRLASTTNVLRVAPPAVVIRPVLPFQVYAREDNLAGLSLWASVLRHYRGFIKVL